MWLSHYHSNWVMWLMEITYTWEETMGTKIGSIYRINMYSLDRYLTGQIYINTHLYTHTHTHTHTRRSHTENTHTHTHRGHTDLHRHVISEMEACICQPIKWFGSLTNFQINTPYESPGFRFLSQTYAHTHRHTAQSDQWLLPYFSSTTIWCQLTWQASSTHWIQ